MIYELAAAILISLSFLRLFRGRRIVRPLSRQNLRPMPTMDMEAMVDTVMAVMDTGDTVERDLLMPMPTMDMEDTDVVMDMVVTDMVDTVASDLLKLKPMPPL